MHSNVVQFDQGRHPFATSLTYQDIPTEYNQVAADCKTMSLKTAVTDIQARVVVGILTRDENLGKYVLDDWKIAMSVGGIEKDTEYQSLDHYLTLRMLDGYGR